MSPQLSLFALGQLLMTTGVRDAMDASQDFTDYALACLRRHGQADWSQMDICDQGANIYALSHGLRIRSSYTDPRFPKRGAATIWIMTEADRSSTTILFPDEY